MKLLYLSFFALIASVLTSPTDQIDKVGELIGKGNVHELANYFAPNVDLTILDDVNTYPKAQAEVVLTKFFAQNRPTSYKMLHKVNSGANFTFGVVTINTVKGVFRAAFTLKAVGENVQLTELRMESEKVK